MSKVLLPAIVALALLGNSAMAQTKLATVDMSKLFKNYYKTKLVQADLDQHRQQIQKDEQGQVDDLKTANNEYQQLLNDADNQALSSTDRDAKKQAAQAKYKEIQDAKTVLDQYDQSATAQLNQEIRRMHDKLVADIQEKVTIAAKKGGYTLVLDSSAQAATSTPVLLYSSGENDLTDQVLSQLNAGAPIDISAPASPINVTPPPLTNSSTP